MPVDSFSPFAPARIRVLVVPAGKIRRSRYHEFSALLNDVSVVALNELSSDESTSHLLLAPSKFQNGRIFYDFVAWAASDVHSALAPFELFREPTLVLGLADGQEYDEDAVSSTDSEARLYLDSIVTNLRDQYPRCLVCRLLIFDQPVLEATTTTDSDLIFLPTTSASKPALSDIIKDITRMLLVELSSYATSIQSLPSIASPTVPRPQGVQPQWFGEDGQAYNRPVSQLAHASHVSSPAVSNKELHRMSMPVFSSPASNLSDPTLRMGSPTSNRAPAKTFDEMTSSHLAANNSSSDRLKARPGSFAPSREPSSDRVAVSGFGSDSTSERTRNKGKGRVEVVLASVYLQAGQWPDALKSAVQGGMKARAHSDHMWHAKALEIIISSMLLLAWSGMDFQFPSICNPIVDSSTLSKSSNASDVNSSFDVGLKPVENKAAKTSLLKALTSTVTVVVHMIITIYNRASHASAGDIVPQLVYSECMIRLSKLFTAINLADGIIDDKCLSELVLAKHIMARREISLSKGHVHPSKRDIAAILAAALPNPHEDNGLSPSDSILILAGIASVYHSLNMQRKKSFIVRELLSTLIPGLTQAQIIGAAEAGIHPSSGLTAIAQANGNSSIGDEQGLEGFLNLLCHTYGIPESKWTRSIANSLVHENGANGTHRTANSLLPKELLGSFLLRSFGDIQIKIDILRLCIELCEALADYQGVLHYSTTLLRTAGPGVAPSAATTDVLVNLSSDDQVQIATKINRTVNEAKLAGLVGIEAEYWDEFLVRGLYILDSSGPFLLKPHRKADLKTTKVVVKDPFIHNPFLDVSRTQKWPNLLATGDEREFVVSLQNPFDFAVEIEYLRLTAGNVDLGITKQNFTLKPYRTQSFSISGNLSSTGLVEVTGCIVKVQGCNERLFPIFNEAWTPPADVKIKDLGLLQTNGPNSRVSKTSSMSLEEYCNGFPKSSHISLTAIPEQPTLVISRSSVAEDAVMLVEGEQAKLSLTVTNTSTTVADFIHISVYDSISLDLQKALSQKGILPADLYEMEYQLVKIPAIEVDEYQPQVIQPSCSETFHFTVRAKPGLTTAVFQFDYACLQVPHVADEDTFFTRQVTYNLALTVNASIQVHRLEIVPLSFDGHIGPSQVADDTAIDPSVHTEEEQCLVLVDLRNAWPSPLTASLQLTSPLESSADHSLSNSVVIKPGQIVRQILAVPKIYISNPHQRIMPISASRNRQFVVSTDRISPELERSIREVFWFREALLKCISGSWKFSDDETDRGRGMIDLRNIRFHPRMIEALRLPDLDVQFSLESTSATRLGKSKFQVQVNEFCKLKITLRNRSPKTISPMLRLQPLLADQSREANLDISKRLAWSGSLQRPITRIQPQGEASIEIPICALCEGEFEISASVEEIQPALDERQKDGRKNELLDDLVMDEGRRTWIGGRICRLVAVEDETT